MIPRIKTRILFCGRDTGFLHSIIERVIYIYWKIEKIKSYDRLFNFVIGGRGIGKTYGCKLEAIKNYLRNGEQFIYLRRYKEELKPLKNNKFFESIENQFKVYEFNTKGESLQLRKIVQEGEEKPKFETCGYMVNLSTALTKKSVDYQKVTMIIYDEFIIPKGYIHYLPNEVESFLDFYETVARVRDNVKVYFLSNSISAFNPYFTYFKIIPPKEGEIFKTKQLVVEMPKMQDFVNYKKSTKFGQLIAGTKYESYAIDNEFYLDNETFIANRSEKSKYYCTLIFKGKNIGVWADYKEGKFYCSKNYDKNYKIVFALTASDHTENAFYTRINKPPQLKNLVKAYSLGILFFENQEIKGYMTEALEMIK